jgi:CheY-like chemotaxis protein/AraC-like DNA-binding protein/anti-sigma regulatory factor (Ser/Thr protein kinase)
MKLEVSEQNIIQLLKGSFLSFASLAERKKITFKLNTTEENLDVYIDEDKVEKVINNLLSNAFKFTQEGGIIELKVSKDEEYVNISIQDTGVGIPKEKISKIFDRFYQVDGTHKREYEGTGIGLALSKELIELHKGKIGVESVEGKGTTITISIPLGKKHFKTEEIRKYVRVEKTDTDLIPESMLFEETKYEKFNANAIIETKKLLMLLVEDNSDVRSYIRENMENEYTILEAVNGEEGLKKSIEHIPDLIVSDIMMPKMDGFELCEKLKTDERTSHIPVILLTAKATSKDKITGYETGADDYIMKPFDVKELRVRVKNLIEQRKKLREHFLQEGIFSLDSKDITSIDRKFFERAIKIINEHLSDLSFGVESFASELSIGRTTLYKKLIAIVGEPPGDFIKRIRLSKANELIKIKSGNISEIALEVGFNNPAYFSECFKKQFGVTPSKYQSTFTNH